ncbi:MAG: hypothetical protein IID31_10180 [Planctomycetes bacterium]|nr:hypothetical protein [Planctomycetota bacterium]
MPIELSLNALKGVVRDARTTCGCVGCVGGYGWWHTAMGLMGGAPLRPTSCVAGAILRRMLTAGTD